VSSPPDWFTHSRLWLVLDEAAAAPRSLLEVTRRGLAGGVDVIVFRQRNTPKQHVLELAMPVRELCRQQQVPFVLSYYPQLAVELKPDAVQIGVADGPLTSVREALGQGTPLGYSAHSAAEAETMLAAGCSYCFLGPIFATPEKLQYGQPIGLGPLRLDPSTQERLVAIGGITTANVSAVLDSGVQRIAVIAAIQRQPDPAAAAAQLRRLLPG